MIEMNFMTKIMILDAVRALFKLCAQLKRSYIIDTIVRQLQRNTRATYPEFHRFKTEPTEITFMSRVYIAYP